MGESRKVVVAIPNYNMSQEVERLVPQLIGQGFDSIFILDDKSSKHLAEFADSKVEIIRGVKNLGAAGNRNRIIGALEEKHYDDNTVIVFIDADTELVDESLTPRKVLDLVNKHPDAGVIGGCVLNSDGSWGAFNYGPLGIRKWILGAWTQMKLEKESKIDSSKANSDWLKESSKLLGWPNFFEKPEPKEVGWLVETLIFVELGKFKEVGGYDKHLRYCEALDLGYKLEGKGLKRIFDPSITVKHLQIDSRGFKRNLEVLSALARIMLKRSVRR